MKNINIPMEKILLTVAVVFFVTVCHAQTPRKTQVKDANDKFANQEVVYRKAAVNGKIIYQKGKCMWIGPRSLVCTYCDNAELTENCKEYLCDNRGMPVRVKPKTGGEAGKATTKEVPKKEDPDQGGEVFKKPDKKTKQ